MRSITLFVLSAALAAACSRPSPEVIQVREAWISAADTVDNTDSPALWHDGSGRSLVLATAKESNRIMVYDALDGTTLPAIGEGLLQRPNGVAVVDSIAFIVERDNRRVHVLSLPSGRSLGTFGEDVLRWPYGVWITPEAGGLQVLVTDNYETVDEQVPPDSLLGERVREFFVTITADSVAARYTRSFGETSGEGVLRVVESILRDGDRIVVAEEIETGSMLKIYGTDGRFTGSTVPTQYFPNQAEGLALYACADGSGYLFTTDQAPNTSTFQVFDRKTLEHLGAFRGAVTANTDGIALDRTPFGPYADGLFLAVHDDQAVSAFDVATILEALDLPGCAR